MHFDYHAIQTCKVERLVKEQFDRISYMLSSYYSLYHHCHYDGDGDGDNVSDYDCLGDDVDEEASI